MSILQIGQYSRQYQGSPGNRKYVSPFLTNQEKITIQRQKEINQNKYRQILMAQMKTNQKRKQAQKQKQIEQDMKHQRLFYQKIKVYRQIDSRISGRTRVIGGSFTRSIQNDIPTYEANIFKKSKQLTLPPLQSALSNSRHQKQKFNSPTLQHSKYSQPQNSYLKYKSLMQIGSKLRDERIQRGGGSLLLDNEIQQLRNQDLSRIGKSYFEKTYYKPEKKFKQLKNQLKEKQIEIYQLLEKSSQMIHSTKSPLKQVKKRLSTQPVYIPQEFQQDDTRQIVIRSRLKTQFQPHVFDDEDQFYRLPLKSTISSIDQTSNHMMTMGQQSQSIPSYRVDDMMRIEEENPQMQSTDHNEEQNYEQNENENQG